MGERVRRTVFPGYGDLDPDEKKVLDYFFSNISVGEIIAQRELKVLEGVENPQEVIDRLVEKGLLERSMGCINLSKHLREQVFRKRAGR